MSMVGVGTGGVSVGGVRTPAAGLCLCLGDTVGRECRPGVGEDSVGRDRVCVWVPHTEWMV